MNKENFGNVVFTDMSDGKALDHYKKSTLINQVLRAMKDGKSHYSIRTGNFLVVALRYETEISIFITESYKSCSVYDRDPEIELKDLVAF